MIHLSEEVARALESMADFDTKRLRYIQWKLTKRLDDAFGTYYADNIKPSNELIDLFQRLEVVINESEDDE